MLGILELWEGSRRLIKRQRIENIQGTRGIRHLGDEETRPAGHTAESEAIATTRPRVQSCALHGVLNNRQKTQQIWERRGEVV